MIFRKELAERIVRGEKTATRRRMSDNPRSPWYSERCAYEVGQAFAVQPGRGKPRVADARVTALYAQPLGHMEEEDAVAEGFRANGSGSALYHFDAAFEQINGEYLPDEIVWVVEFKLLRESLQQTGEGQG